MPDGQKSVVRMPVMRLSVCDLPRLHALPRGRVAGTAFSSRALLTVSVKPPSTLQSSLVQPLANVLIFKTHWKALVRNSGIWVLIQT